MTDRERQRTDTEEFERAVQREADRREIRREMEYREGRKIGQQRNDQTRMQEEELAGQEPTERGPEQSERSSAGLVARGVIANGPWKMFLSFRIVIATALATGAYALIFPTLWQLADSFSWPRLVGLMIAAIVVMIGWMTISHSLWERPSDEAEKDSRISARMQNVVTMLTLITGVLISYAVLFGLIFAAALVFVEDGIYQSNVGHSASPYDLAVLAWVAASISTITGSLGGGLEDDTEMREAVNVR